MSNVDPCGRYDEGMGPLANIGAGLVTTPAIYLIFLAPRHSTRHNINTLT